MDYLLAGFDIFGICQVHLKTTGPRAWRGWGNDGPVHPSPPECSGMYSNSATKETIEPDKNCWELCSRALARKGRVEKLSGSWCKATAAPSLHGVPRIKDRRTRLIEITSVPGHDREVMLNCGRRNKQVGLRENVSGLPAHLNQEPPLEHDVLR